MGGGVKGGKRWKRWVGEVRAWVGERLVREGEERENR